MTEAEAVKQFNDGELLKFLGNIARPIIFFWAYDEKRGPYHQPVAEEVGYYDHKKKDIKRNIRAGHAIVKKGHIVLTTPSNQFPKAMPTKTEFATMLNGKVKDR